MAMQVVTLSVDEYDERGECVSSVIAVRGLDCPIPSAGLLDRLLDAPEVPWRQMTYHECVAHFSLRKSSADDPWDQLTLF